MGWSSQKVMTHILAALIFQAKTQTYISNSVACCTSSSLDLAINVVSSAWRIFPSKLLIPKPSLFPRFSLWSKCRTDVSTRQQAGHKSQSMAGNYWQDKFDEAKNLKGGDFQIWLRDEGKSLTGECLHERTDDCQYHHHLFVSNNVTIKHLWQWRIFSCVILSMIRHDDSTSTIA